MLMTLLTHKRLPLFAPFIGLALLTLTAFGFWHFAAARLADNLQESGISWQHLQRQGFPARITLALQAAEWRDRDSLWQNEKLTITTMPFNPRHAIVDFSGPHLFRHADRRIELTHQGNLMSVVGNGIGGGAGLQRASFEAKAATLTLLSAQNRHSAMAALVSAHMRRTDTAHQLAVTVKDLQTDLSGPQFERVDLAVTAPHGFLQNGPTTGQLLVLDRLMLSQAGFSVVARGRVKLRAQGQMDGTIDLDIVNLPGFIERLVAAGIIDRRQKRKFLLLGGLGAALGGDTQDRLSLQLTLAKGRIRLGPLDLGDAPRWQ